MVYEKQSKDKIASANYLKLDYDNRKEQKELKAAMKITGEWAHDYNEYGAYSMNWPYFCFGDFLGNVYAVNMFDKGIMYRIPIIGLNANRLSDTINSDFRICATYTTMHMRVFVLIYSKNKF